MSKKSAKATAPPAAIVDVKGKKRAAPEAVATAPAKSKKPEKIKLRRVHVSGLPAGLSEQDVKNRFKSFGEVKSVDNLGKLDGNGHPLRYAFLDIETTKSKLAQCMNLLSGSMWKGSTLRIAEAKPTFMDRLARERQSEAAKQQNNDTEVSVNDDAAAVASDKPAGSKKRKRAEGAESTHQDLIDAESAKSREGWKVDPQTGTPIFPIVARPDHPLPPIPEASTSSKAKKSSKLPASKVDKNDKKAVAKEKKKEKKARAAAEAEATAEPPNRAHRVKIDPTRWKPTHLRGGDMSESSAVEANPSLEEPKADSDSSSDEDDEEARSDDTSPEQQEDAQSSSLPAVDAMSGPTPEDNASIAESLADMTGDGAESNIESVDLERTTQLDLLTKMLGRAPERIEMPETVTQVVESEDSSSEEVDDADPLTAEVAGDTGGASASTLEEEAILTTNTMNIVEAGEEVESDASSETDSSSEAEEEQANQPAAQPAIHMNSLTEMFKPQEAGLGFMLGDLLDEGEFDLEELAEEPAAPQQTLSFRPPTQSIPVAQSRAAVHRPGAYDPHEPLFFPFPIEEDELPGGVAYHLTESQRAALLERSWTGISEFKRFKRTQNIEDITAQYETARKSLNEQVRKRHREAVKTRKRNGGKRSKGLFAQEED